METSVHFLIYNSPPLIHILSQLNLVQLRPTSWRFILITSSHLRLTFQVVFSSKVFSWNQRVYIFCTHTFYMHLQFYFS
jgi:hypothetical protein